MSALTLRLSSSVHESIKLLARKDGISVNQFKPAQIVALEASFTLKDTAKTSTPYVTCLVLEGAWT